MGSQVYSCEIAMSLKRCPIRAGNKISTTCFGVLVHIDVLCFYIVCFYQRKKCKYFLSFHAIKNVGSHIQVTGMTHYRESCKRGLVRMH